MSVEPKSLLTFEVLFQAREEIDRENRTKLLTSAEGWLGRTNLLTVAPSTYAATNCDRPERYVETAPEGDEGTSWPTPD